MSEYHPYKHGETSRPTYPESTITNTSRSNCSKSAQSTKATKRIRGEIACAECRRLKIKCDRLVPCSTCVKRGCQTLCPNGTIPPGQGSRFVLAATDHLQRKLAKYEARMHSLEDALTIAQTAYNLDPHPLLVNREDVDTDSQALKAIEPAITEDQDMVSPDVSGSLHVSGSGINRFFGPSGAPEDLQPQEDRLKSSSIPRLPELDNSYLPPEIINFTHAFPFTPPNIPIASTQRSIESFLPPIQRAVSLCDTFLENLSWMFHIVSRQLLISELIPAIYEGTALYGPHDLALLFSVLAIGVLVDINVEPYHLESQHFYQLSKAALVLQPVMTESSVVTIKVLHLLSIYNGLSGQESNLEQSYALVNLAGKVATQVYIDPSSWKFTGREAYDRRVYWWNLLAGILWNSLVTGRPSGITAEFITCKIPTVEEEEMYQKGIGVWGFQTTYSCLLPLVHITLSARQPPYEAVLELDAKVRFAVNPQPDSDPMDNRTAISMRTFVRSHYSHLMLLYLHRPFFTRAMTEHPSNPLLSPFGKSVITAYHAACTVLDDTRIQYEKKPRLVSRVWQIWSFAYSAAVIVGTIASRASFLELEPRPIDQLKLACELFRGAAKVSSRAAKALFILDAMLQEAQKRRIHDLPDSIQSQLDPMDTGFYEQSQSSLLIDDQLPSQTFSRSSSAPYAHSFTRPVPIAPNRRFSLPSSSHPQPVVKHSFPHPSQNWGDSDERHNHNHPKDGRL
ncbi:hypothetical protein C8R42DRAFT_678428 [Lentinula raphanica]|nr:hypothetical protein C8R42DRAFT_678428 [Lentinula raphanica]